MATIREALQLAVQHFQAGRMAEAEDITSRVLAVEPGHGDASNLLGVILANTGRVGAAIAHLRAGVQARPDADRQANLAMALALTGDTDGAFEAFSQALTHDPGHGAARRGLATLARGRGRESLEAGREAAALADLRLAWRLEPDDMTVALWLGTAAQESGEVETARRAYRVALCLDPAMAAAWTNLAALTPQEGDVKRWRWATRLLVGSIEPSDILAATVWRGVADVLVATRDRRAASACRVALCLRPDDQAAWVNLGAVADDMVETGARRALVIEPRSPHARQGLAEALLARGEPDLALREARRALYAAPLLAEAAITVSRAALTLGLFQEGWANQEARWRMGAAKATGGRPLFDIPRWDGGPLDGPLLVWGEQGLGDEVMLAASLPELLTRGLSLIVWIDTRLHPLLARVCPELTLARRPGDDPRAITAAAEIALGDLPALLRRDLGSFPVDPAPHLRADPDQAARWRSILLADQPDARLIGVWWRSSDPRTGARRSIDPTRLAAALTVGDRPTRFVCLQYGDVDADIARARFLGSDVVAPPGLDIRDDIDGLAAVIAAMDLNVGIDNATAHLAGGLGVPVWIALPYAADWRWLLAREDSPWYPTARLFRQAGVNDWDGVLAAMTAALRAAWNGDTGALLPTRFIAPPPPDDAAEIAAERDKYTQVWDTQTYRTVSPGAMQAAQYDLPALLRRHGARTALDAGCGSGKTTLHVLEHGDGSCRMYGFDIAANCLDPQFDAIKDDYLTVGCLWVRDDFRDHYDAVICTDVLEHIPPDKVPLVLANFRAICAKVAFLGIALFKDHFGPSEMGEALHLTVEPPEWWLARLAEAGFEVVMREVVDHPAVGPAWLIVEAVPVDRS